jgi:hypothetical protein
LIKEEKVGIKKILYIAFKYEYGKQENGTALNYKAWFENFEKLGYEIEGIFVYIILSFHMQNVGLRLSASCER